MGNLILVLILLLTISCSSSIHISSSNKIPVSFGEMDKHNKNSLVEIERDTFLWSTVPKVHKVDLAKELSNKGFTSFSEVKIFERNSVRDVVWSVLTLGFWTPKTLIVEGKKSTK